MISPAPKSSSAVSRRTARVALLALLARSDTEARAVSEQGKGIEVGEQRKFGREAGVAALLGSESGAVHTCCCRAAR
jgi:hypothetical protein